MSMSTLHELQTLDSILECVWEEERRKQSRIPATTHRRRPHKPDQVVKLHLAMSKWIVQFSIQLVQLGRRHCMPSKFYGGDTTIRSVRRPSD